MIRGSTPTHTFTLPIDAAQIDKLRITYAQNGKVLVTKTDADATMEGSVVQVKLTQEDTLAFKCNRDVEVQVEVLTPAGDKLPSNIIRVPVGRCLNDEVLE